MAATPPPPGEAPRRRLTAWQAVLAGQIVVNLPVVLLFYGVYQLAGPVLPTDTFGYWLRLIASFAASMAWGVYASRRWQRWAVRRGVKEADLQRLAGMTLLMMPRSTPRGPPPIPKPPRRK